MVSIRVDVEAFVPTEYDTVPLPVPPPDVTEIHPAVVVAVQVQPV